MALTTQAAQLVRQKTNMITLSPGIFYGLKALFLHLAANRGNPDLQFVPVDTVLLASDKTNTAQQVIANVACHLYAFYLKKFGTVAVSYKISDSATVVTGNGTDAGPSGTLTVLSDDTLQIYPQGGHNYVNGIAFTEQTTQTGTTQTLFANRAEGFFIIGT